MTTAEMMGIVARALGAYDWTDISDIDIQELSSDLGSVGKDRIAQVRGFLASGDGQLTMIGVIEKNNIEYREEELNKIEDMKVLQEVIDYEPKNLQDYSSETVSAIESAKKKRIDELKADKEVVDKEDEFTREHTLGLMDDLINDINNATSDTIENVEYDIDYNLDRLQGPNELTSAEVAEVKARLKAKKERLEAEAKLEKEKEEAEEARKEAKKKRKEAEEAEEKVEKEEKDVEEAEERVEDLEE